ncbi:MAG TPA: rod shape-determining protein MreC [Streptosporangiaceae bacterium]|nr:rod shape-determining protein MreC [Streptosporangiaceae bacterium]
MHDTRRTRLVLGVLLIVAIGLITLDHRGFTTVGGMRGISAAFFGPVERVTADVTRPVTGFFEAVAGAPSARRKIQALEQEDQRLRAEVSAAQLNKADAAELNRLLQVGGLGGYRLVAAHVIGIGQGYEDTVTIDAGTSDGVKTDQTVLNDAGLVGRVIQATTDTSTVLLATDASSAVGCRLEGTQEIGVVQGTGKSLSAQGGLRVELLDANAVLQAGQRLVTLGSVSGHPYVPGVPIGTVSQVASTPGALTRTAIVRPFVQFTALDVVGVVIVAPRHDPRDSVLPPRPSPSPSPSPSAGRSHAGRASPSPGVSPAATPATPATTPAAQAAMVTGGSPPRRATMPAARPAIQLAVQRAIQPAAAGSIGR